jgi:lipid-A-disaccharide synthase
MRVFLATGEASGDMLAAALATGIRDLVPAAQFEGIGGERMAAAGVKLSASTAGWGAMGPLEALRTIPQLLLTLFWNALRLLASPRDLIVLVDFGAGNLRLARFLRRFGYRRPILYFLPPGAWLDIAPQARDVARNAMPLTAFAHQRDFYRSLSLEVAYFGHPLVSLVQPRAERLPPAADGGTIALLPGSRRAEIARHMPRLLQACRLLRERRPRATFVVSAADRDAENSIRRQLAGCAESFPIVRGARAAIDVADAAWIASGTAVLEAVLREVPCVALYVIAPAQVPIAKRMWRGPYATLPNILLEREVVPELLQDDATPERLADALENVLAGPAAQLAAARAVRTRLGEPDALQRCAAFAVTLARS